MLFRSIKSIPFDELIDENDLSLVDKIASGHGIIVRKTRAEKSLFIHLRQNTALYIENTPNPLANYRGMVKLCYKRHNAHKGL